MLAPSTPQAAEARPSDAAKRSAWRVFINGDHPLFARSRVLTMAVVAALVLSFPLLFNGYYLDDYQQRITMLGEGGNAFDFFSRGSAMAEAQMEAGVLPWWTSADSKVRFFRPIAQWLMAVDYRLWPDNLVLMHLHSALWYALLVFVAGIAYRALMPTAWTAGFATVLFAVDSSHAGAVGWLANRNILICLLSGLLCLLCHRRGTWASLAAGSALFCLGMASGEAALGICGYLFAYEVCLAEGPWRARILRLLPYAVIATAWISWWRIAGYGASGPGFYIDPGHEPLHFLHELLFRAPSYLAGWFFLPSADVLGLLLLGPVTRPYVLPYVLAVLALLAWLLRPLVRASATARFYALGMLIAVIPICASVVVSRALWYVGFGAIGLLSLYAQQWREPTISLRPARLASAFMTVMLLLHLWLSPLFYVVSGKMADLFDGFMDTRAVQLPNTGTESKQLLLLSSLLHVSNITFPLLKDQALSMGPAPARPTPTITRVRGLVEGEGGFTLSRPAHDHLLVRADADRPGAAFTTMRKSPYGFHAGDTVRLSDVTVTVRDVNAEGAARTIELAFQPGALAGYQVMSWQHGHFEPDRLPAVGESRHLVVDKAF